MLEKNPVHREFNHTLLFHRCGIRIYSLVWCCMIARFSLKLCFHCYLQPIVWTTLISLSRTPGRQASFEGIRSAPIKAEGRSRARRRFAAGAAVREGATWWSGSETRDGSDTSHSVKSSSIKALPEDVSTCTKYTCEIYLVALYEILGLYYEYIQESL